MELIRRVRIKAHSFIFSIRYSRRFIHLGAGSFMFPPFRIDGERGISLGKATSVQSGGWLYCQGLNGGQARLKIGNGCVIGYNNHITAVESVSLGDFVLTANNVYISDNVHSYQDVTKAIMHQPVTVKGRVEIGDGTWLGENVAVIGASIGKNCVIGANAVVTHDIPDYCVAVGIPARVIRQYDLKSKKWLYLTQERS